jgi:ELWxxDGT repeat protein
MARVLFAGVDSAGNYGLWITNGTARGTHEITVNGAQSGSGGLNPSGFTVFKHEVIFGGHGNYAGGQDGLWITDGTTAGTHEIAVNGAAPFGVEPSGFVVFKGKVLFNGFDAAISNGLWVTDGTTAGTHEIVVNGANTNTIAGVHPYDLTVFYNEVLFGGIDAGGKQGLWVTDGTTAGTHEITGGVTPHDLTVFDHAVLFAGGNRAHEVGLWVTDGSTAGTHEITVNGAYSTGVHPFDLTVFNNKVLFEGVDAAGINALWLYNGQTVSEITGITGALPSGLNASELTAFNNEVLFNGFDASGHRGLWVTNGTASGTYEITVNGAALNGLNPTDFLVVNKHEVLFSGVDAPSAGQNGPAGIRGLWETDGTTAGTHEITGIRGASLSGLSPVDLTLFSAMHDSSNAWTGSGAAHTTSLLGQYIASSFATPSDGHGATLVTDPAVNHQWLLAPSVA